MQYVVEKHSRLDQDGRLGTNSNSLLPSFPALQITENLDGDLNCPSLSAGDRVQGL